MRLDVFFAAHQVAPGDTAGRVVAIIDVLRASASNVVALANGARAVVPLDTSEEVVTRAQTFARSEVQLAGEQKMLPIPGFDLGTRRASSRPRPSRGRPCSSARRTGPARDRGPGGA